MEQGRVKAVAFDLDHTLYDRYETLRRIACFLKQRYGDRLSSSLSEERLGDVLVETDRLYIYQGWEIMYEKLIEGGMFRNPPSFREIFDFFMEFFQKIAVPFPGVDSMLCGLRNQGYRLGLLTNGESRIQRAKVRLLGLEKSFDRILAGEEMGLQKPAAQAFAEMARCMECPVEQMLYVGDNPLNDVEAARRAGCIPVWVNVTGRDWDFSEYEQPLYEIHNVLELPVLLEKSGLRREECV